jgi:23S rRNA (uracil1939-C5)-methyltransferase
MGARGEGVARGRDGGPLYVPYTLPGEQVEARVEGARGRLVKLLVPSAERIEPVCRYFGRCGGCQVQHWQPVPYARWKQAMVRDELARRGLGGIEVGDLVDAHGAGRRRVTLTVDRGKAGFVAHRSHLLVPVDACPVLVPALRNAPALAADLAKALGARKELKVHVLASDTGLDCELVGVDDPPLDARVKLADVAEAHDLARLTASGETLIERRRPVLEAGGAAVTPPPGGFAQATRAGEEALAALVVPALAGHDIVVDLFCGWGTFALRLARQSRVLAMDSHKPSVTALEQAVRSTQGLKPVIGRTRDLMRDPVTGPELKGVTGAVFDPPRAGAATQVRELVAADGIRTVVGVSCDAGTFARDAAVLVEGGFRLERVVPVDQFRYSAHVEMVGVFNR